MKYKAIILVIASSDSSSDRYFFKKIKPEWRPFFPILKRVHHAYMNEVSDIKMMFVYGKTEEPLDSNDLSYDVVENDYPGIISKTLMAMEQVDKEYDYDFIVRTNLSTFWDLPKLTKRLDTLPKTNCIAGTPVLFKDPDGNVYNYVAGFDLVMSRDVVKALVEHKQEVIDQKVYGMMEDLSICTAAERYCSHQKFTAFNHACVAGIRDSNMHVIRAMIKQRDADHYRVKTLMDRNMDKKLMNILLLETYGKTIV